VVAGVVAALRSQFPYSLERPGTSSDAIRDLLTKTAENAGTIGHDYEHGWGIINGAQLGSLQALQVTAAAD